MKKHSYLKQNLFLQIPLQIFLGREGKAMKVCFIFQIDQSNYCNVSEILVWIVFCINISFRIKLILVKET
jgi:hypothetical protein